MRSGAGPRSVRRALTAGAALICCALAGVPLAAAERTTWSAEHLPLSTALQRLEALGARPPTTDYGVASGSAAGRPITLDLRAADPAAMRQAIAHAAGLWWAALPADPGSTVLTADAHPPRGQLRVRAHPSGLLESPASEAAVRDLLAPWLGAIDGSRDETTLAYDPVGGTWTAALDADGHAHLVELLSLLQLPRPQAPPALADDATPDPTTAVQVTLPAGPWAAWCAALAQALDGSVALAPGLDAGDTAPAVAIGGTRGELPRALARANLRIAPLRGVWCVGRDDPADRQHPALRRRIAVVPLPHLAADDAAGQRIAALLRRRLPDAPGWSVRWLANGHALLIAADAPAIHRLLDALDVLDRLGPSAGAEALERQPSP